jgi:hypothetical protein
MSTSLSFICARLAIGTSILAGPAATGAAKTELAKVAAAMKPGTWAELKTEGYTTELLGKHDILVYSDRAVWDPNSRQVLFIGQDHLRPPPRFIVYHEKTNRWEAKPTPAWAEKLKWFHAYENNAIDAATGRFFHHPSASRIVHELDITTGKWNTLPEIKGAAEGHGTALEYFPERKGLVRVLGGTVHFYDEGKKTWTVVAKKLPMGGYHNFAAYSAVHRVVLFGGGNDSQDVYRLDTAGKIAPVARAPAVVGIGRSINWVDPVSGELLVLHKTGKFFAYDPGADAWRELSLTGFPIHLRGSGHHVIAAPIASYGVTMLFTSPSRGLKVYLYKHANP